MNLVSWPQRASHWVHQEEAAEKPRNPKGPKSSKTVHWADKKKDVSSGKQLIALLKK